MKKLFNIALALVLSMALFTGCTGGKEVEEETKPTPTPTPMQQEEQIDPYLYESVINLWKGVGGYWVKADGSYIELGIDVNGKAYAHAYDSRNKLIAVVHPTSIMASNKLTYIVETKYPAIENDTVYTGLVQRAKDADFIVDINGIDDGFFMMTDSAGADRYYVLAGKTTEKLADAAKTAYGFENPEPEPTVTPSATPKA